MKYILFALILSSCASGDLHYYSCKSASSDHYYVVPGYLESAAKSLMKDLDSAVYGIECERYE